MHLYEKDFEHNGLKCKVKRLELPIISKYWYYGYVGLPKGHRFYGYQLDKINEVIASNGGMAYADMKDDLWWVGFYLCDNDRWDEESVIEETKKLADQFQTSMHLWRIK